jgi:hypothetical protein
MWRKEDVVQKLQEGQGHDQSLRSYANQIGCSAAYLSDIYNGLRDPGPKILDHLNLTATKITTVTYTPKESKKWRKE